LARQHLRLAIQGSPSQNFLTTTCTIIASVAMLQSIGRSGAGATTMTPSQVRHT
jgi:hypothetical protein